MARRSAAARRADLELPVPDDDPAAGRRRPRVLAPDLIGFGRSDKPTADEDYTYQRHVEWVTSWSTASTCTTSRSSGRTGGR